ncbi:hypothetical protein CVT25_014026 [Psilocybe cyanescens]|uniref:Uncharacterized protein n=1 Tax=Psilocybe cyanescens TaxID=93625 RepID=A0A409XPK8_PSICY|nr:hypothetical protein CVT25_014026 [Psilocybe cyanescens]
MLGSTFLASLCAVFLLWSSIAILSTAAPLGRLSNEIVERDLIPIVEGDEIPPTLVDLQDQVENFQQQVDEGVFFRCQWDASLMLSPGTATVGELGYEGLVDQLTIAKAKYAEEWRARFSMGLVERGIRGVAVFVSSTPELPTETISSTSPSSTFPSSTSEADSVSQTSTSESSAIESANTESASGTTISATPTTSVNTEDIKKHNAGACLVVSVETVVTRVETSLVIIASEAVTSKVPLETITSTQRGTVSSPLPAATSIGPAPGSPNETINDSVPQLTSKPVAPTGKAANSSVGQTQSGALSLAPKSTLTAVFGASLVGMLLML